MKTSFYQETLQKILGKDIKISPNSKSDYTEFKIIKNVNNYVNNYVIIKIYKGGILYNSLIIIEVKDTSLEILDKLLKFSKKTGLFLKNYRLYSYFKKAIEVFPKLCYRIINHDNSLINFTIYHKSNIVTDLKITNYYYHNNLYLKQFSLNKSLNYGDFINKLAKYSKTIGMDYIYIDNTSIITGSKPNTTESCHLNLLIYNLVSKNKDWVVHISDPELLLKYNRGLDKILELNLDHYSNHKIKIKINDYFSKIKLSNNTLCTIYNLISEILKDKPSFKNLVKDVKLKLYIDMEPDYQGFDPRKLVNKWELMNKSKKLESISKPQYRHTMLQNSPNLNRYYKKRRNT